MLIFYKNLQARASVPRGKNQETIPVLKTVASQKEGIPELFKAILHHLENAEVSDKKYQLLAQRVYHIIRDKRMKNIDMEKLVEEIKTAYEQGQFNLYKVVEKYS